MADQDDGPSLELPSFRLGRRRPPAQDAPLFVDETSPPTPPTPAPTPVPPQQRRTLRLPTLPGPVATAVTGLVVGTLAVVLTWSMLRVCDGLTGTSSCGNPGILLLLVVLTGLVLLGAALLRALGVPQPGATSTLAVGLLAVVAMLFPGGVLFAWWMVLAVPAVAVASYVTAGAVTTAARKA